MSRFRSMLAAFLIQCVRARTTQRPSDWACEQLEFDEPKNRGAFHLDGREYLREPIDWWADPDTPDGVKVFGSQAGKTAAIMAGAAWTIANLSAQVFWVMPTRETAKKISKTRWQPLLKASPGTRGLVPSGARRHDFATFQQMLGNSIVDMVWSNSPAALASVPSNVVILDEVDKFNEGGKGEADAVDLAEQRTKDAASPKRMKTSTPTLTEGLIWQEFLKSDMRRRFVPCPHCSKFVVLIWSKNFTVFPITGDEAPVVWDKEARRPNGDWDLDRVHRSARFECPHCGGHIQDHHKPGMDKGGEWRPTSARGSRGYQGWHLPSLYAPSSECGVGRLAVKFLAKQQSLLGLQGFINGDLAEPYQAQDTLGQRVELVTSKLEVTAEWKKVLTVDCQAKAPYFWHVVRAWDGSNSEGIDGGPLDTWEDIRTVQEEHKIEDLCVAIDSGFGARSEADVYRNCARFTEFEPVEVLKRGGLGEWQLVGFGWIPCKGFPGRKRWKDKEQGVLLPYHLQPIDPFRGTPQGGRCTINLFEHADDFYEDILDALRKGKDGHRWVVAPELATEEYWRHMDGHIKAAVRNPRTGRVTHEWQSRSSHWPDHLLDCERLQVAIAHFYKFFPLDLE